MSDKCTRCDGTGLIISDVDTTNYHVPVLTNCPECHGLGRNGE